MSVKLEAQLEAARQNALLTLTRLADVVPVNLTLTGNEITDAARTAALAWPITKQGGSTDGKTPPAGVAVYRAATNLFLNGQCDSLTPWAAIASGQTRTLDATKQAPFAPQSVKDVCDGTVATQGLSAVSATGQAAAAASNGVGSMWFLGVAGASYQTRLQWANTDATVTTGATTTFVATGAWQLLVPPPLAVAAGKTGDQLRIQVFVNGTRAETHWAAHAMLEKSVPIVSPYVATSGGVLATRAAAGPTAPASMLNATQSWVAIRLRMGWAATAVDGTFPSVFRWQTDTSNRIISYYSASGKAFSLSRVAAGAGVGPSSPVQAFAAGDPITLVYAWTATSLRLSVNGAPFVSIANSSIPATPTGPFQIATGDAPLNSTVRWAAAGTGTLADADAAALHANGDTPPDIHTVPGAPTMVWPCVTASANTLPPVAAWPAGTTVTIERESPSGNVAAVRGAVERDVAGVTQALIRDYEVPLDLDLVYTATLSDGSTATATFRIDWSDCEPWFVDLSRPTNSLPAKIQSFTELNFDQPSGVHRVLERRAPVLTALPAYTPEGELIVLADTLSERDRLRNLFGSGYPFLLRTDPAQGIGNIYLGLTAFVEERFLSDGYAPQRRFRVATVQVERPDPAVYVPVAPNTYANVKATWATYAALKAAVGTYDQLAYTYPANPDADVVSPWPPNDV